MQATFTVTAKDAQDADGREIEKYSEGLEKLNEHANGPKLAEAVRALRQEFYTRVHGRTFTLGTDTKPDTNPPESWQQILDLVDAVLIDQEVFDFA